MQYRERQLHGLAQRLTAGHGDDRRDEPNTIHSLDGNGHCLIVQAHIACDHLEGGPWCGSLARDNRHQSKIGQVSCDAEPYAEVFNSCSRSRYLKQPRYAVGWDPKIGGI